MAAPPVLEHTSYNYREENTQKKERRTETQSTQSAHPNEARENERATHKTCILPAGQTAPEEIYDTSQRSSEKFKEVKAPYYYKLQSADAPSLFGVTPDGNPTYSQALATPYSIEILHKGQSISSIQSVFLMKSMNVEYKWYVSQGSSAGSSTIDCRNSAYNYPGTRFANKITCESWCQNTVKGTWYSGANCYSNRQFGYQKNGCCRVYYALDAVCTSVKDSGTGTFSESASKGCVTGYSSDKRYPQKTQTSIQGSSTVQFSGSLGSQQLVYKFYQPPPQSGVYLVTGALTAGASPLPQTGSNTHFSTKLLDITVTEGWV